MPAAYWLLSEIRSLAVDSLDQVEQFGQYELEPGKPEPAVGSGGGPFGREACQDLPESPR